MPSGTVTPAGGGGSTPNLATVLAQGGDPSGHPITAPLTVDLGALATAGGLTVTGTSGANVNRLVVDFLHTLLSLTGDGVMSIASDDNMSLQVRGTGNSAAALGVFNDPVLYEAELAASNGEAHITAYDSTSTRRAVASTTLGLMVAVHAAPADGDLAAGECSVWFDQTNGAGNTKLMAKAKSADGTVKTATILLA